MSAATYGSAVMEEAHSLLGASDTVDDEAFIQRRRARTIKGFLSYSMSSEVFVIVAGTLLLPVLLETYARVNGQLGPDYSMTCPLSADTEPGAEARRCAVRLLGARIDTASFSLYTYSLSVAMQAVTVISIGALADDPRSRHRFLSTFAGLGAGACMLFVLLPSSSRIWPLCILLAVTANVCYGASIVCLNAYLPELGSSSPTCRALHSQLELARSELLGARQEGGDSRLSASQNLIRATDEANAARAAETSRISSQGIAAGYAAGIAALLLMVVPVGLGGGSAWSLRLAVAGTGAVWGVGSIPAIIWLRPLDDGTRHMSPAEKNDTSFSSLLLNSWRDLLTTLRQWRRLPATFVFLAAWFLLSDGFATVTSTAILYAKTSLGLSTSSLIIVAALTPSAGIAGAIAFPRVQRSLALTNLQTVQMLVALATLVPLWGIVALRQAWQIYAVAIVFGAIYGSFQAYARACFAELIPSSEAARFFGLYSITDKSSSFLGPLLVAIMTSVTNEIRHGFWLILVMLCLALPILRAVDMDKGRADAEAYERDIVSEHIEIEQ